MHSRGSKAGHIASVLREDILRGKLRPGQRLSEEAVRDELDISRSTLREAFQWVIRDRLAVHHLSRGVFVRTIPASDIADIYAARRVIECGALASLVMLRPEALRSVERAIAEHKTAWISKQYDAAALANARFHEAIVALAGSERLSSEITVLLGEHRLAFARLENGHDIHEFFLTRNIRIAELIRRGRIGEAVPELRRLLEDSERLFAGGGVELRRQRSVVR